MRIVFMGTPDFAAGVLTEVSKWEYAEIIAAYTQPDSVSGRGKKLCPPQVKVLAQSMGIPVVQPRSFRKDPQAVDDLRALDPDVLVVAAYGLILPREVLEIPPMGAWNVHASLLPKYRGAAPVQRCLINGESMSGVTILRMEEGLDTGPMLLQQAVAINESDDAGSLLAVLSEKGGVLMRGALDMIRENRAVLIPQNDALSSYASKLTKEEAVIGWDSSARKISCLVRGFSPNPGATTEIIAEGRPPVAARIERGRVVREDGVHGAPGSIIGVTKEVIEVACGEGTYGIEKLRPAGKNSLDAVSFRNGYMRGGSVRFGKNGLA